MLSLGAAGLVAVAAPALAEGVVPTVGRLDLLVRGRVGVATAATTTTTSTTPIVPPLVLPLVLPLQCPYYSGTSLVVLFSHTRVLW